MNLSTFSAFKNLPDKGLITIEGELLSQYQEVLRQITDDAAEVCESNRINYTLGGGSALGAVRHKGMIPWDDDMDLNLFRKDYERFLEAFQKKYGDKYWIHTPETTHNYGLLFIQIRKKGTIMQGREDRETHECGIPLDIFPVENTFDNGIARCLHGIACMSMKFGLSCRKMWEDRRRSLELVKGNKAATRDVQLKVFLGFFMALFSVDTWTKAAIRCCKLCKKEGRYVVIPSGRKQFFGEIYERVAYQETELVPFDGRQYRLTKAADKYLNHLYGDYTQIPPVEKREKHIVYELQM